MGVLIAVDEAAAGVSECLTDWNRGGRKLQSKLKKKKKKKKAIEARCVPTVSL